MPAGPAFRMHGQRELYATFAALPKATKRNVLLRTLREVIAPLASAVTAKVPYLTGFLGAHQFTGETRQLTRRQRRAEQRADAGTFTALIHFGTADPAGMMNEFGNANMSPQPYFRQEWEQRKMGLVDDIGKSLGPQIEAAGARLAKKGGRG